jgi:subtilisin family serine protease
MSLDQARRAVSVVDAAATADLDHYYYTDEGPDACAGGSCEVAALVGWSPSASRTCDASPEIGLIDTAVDLGHAALKDQSVEIVATGRPGATASQPEHGTAMAALLVGRTDSGTPGLLPRARLVAVDAFTRDGRNADRADVVSLVSALEALVRRDIRVINMSLSGPPNEVLRQAIEAAQAKGVLIVAAAGNNGPGAEPSFPAAYAGVVAVTAVDQDLKIYARATRGDYIDLAAPGVAIRTASAAGVTAVKSGTSYAVPFIAAAAALVRAGDPALDVQTMRTRLEASTRDLGEPGRDTTYGYGLIQMSRLCPPPADERPIAQSGALPTETP